MSVDDNKALVRCYNDAIWRGDEATVRDMLAADCTIHGNGGPDDILNVFRAMRAGNPHLSGTIAELLAEDDKVVIRWTMRGTHRGALPGPFGPRSATGTSLNYTGITINRIVNNKIVDHRFEGGYFGLVAQLGGFPSTQPADSPS